MSAGSREKSHKGKNTTQSEDVQAETRTEMPGRAPRGAGTKPEPAQGWSRAAAEDVPRCQEGKRTNPSPTAHMLQGKLWGRTDGGQGQLRRAEEAALETRCALRPRVVTDRWDPL